MTYCDLDVLKASVGVFDPDDDSLDAALTAALSAADEVIDNFCKRKFHVPAGDATPVARICRVSGRVIHTADIASAAGLSIRYDADGDGICETVLDPLSYETYPLNAIADDRPIEAIRLRGCSGIPTDRVEVVALYGWPITPASVVEAARLQSARLWKRKDAALGIAGSPELGSMRVLAKIDADVQVLLTPLRKGRKGLTSVRF